MQFVESKPQSFYGVFSDRELEYKLENNYIDLTKYKYRLRIKSLLVNRVDPLTNKSKKIQQLIALTTNLIRSATKQEEIEYFSINLRNNERGDIFNPVSNRSLDIDQLSENKVIFRFIDPFSPDKKIYVPDDKTYGEIAFVIHCQFDRI